MIEKFVVEYPFDKIPLRRMLCALHMHIFIQEQKIKHAIIKVKYKWQVLYFFTFRFFIWDRNSNDFAWHIISIHSLIQIDQNILYDYLLTERRKSNRNMKNYMRERDEENVSKTNTWALKIVFSPNLKTFIFVLSIEMEELFKWSSQFFMKKVY